MYSKKSLSRVGGGRLDENASLFQNSFFVLFVYTGGRFFFVFWQGGNKNDTEKDSKRLPHAE